MISKEDYILTLNDVIELINLWLAKYDRKINELADFRDFLKDPIIWHLEQDLYKPEDVTKIGF